jgi:hypothetical protein
MLRQKAYKEARQERCQEAYKEARQESCQEAHKETCQESGQESGQSRQQSQQQSRQESRQESQESRQKARREARQKKKQEIFDKNKAWLEEYEAEIAARRQKREVERKTEQEADQKAYEQARIDYKVAKEKEKQLKEEARKQRIRDILSFEDRNKEAISRPRSSNQEYVQEEPRTPISQKRIVRQRTSSLSSTSPKRITTNIGHLSSSPSKRRRYPNTPISQPELIPQQKLTLKALLDNVENDFEQKLNMSKERTWCNPIPQSRKIETIQSFLQAMTNKETLPIATCHFCYLKKCPSELSEFNWKIELVAALKDSLKPIFQCQRCFPTEEGQNLVPVCESCLRAFRQNKIPKDCSSESILIGCECRYPPELDSLTPLEEKLISLNTAYGYITKFAITKSKIQGGGLAYRKHIKGHITVFPNDIESLTTTVLPHPLLESLSNIHIIWSGSNQPTPQDISKLFSVRKDVIQKSLQWLQQNNPLYSKIKINREEIQSWELDSNTNVPLEIFQQMEQQDQSAEDQIRTAHIVPPESLSDDQVVDQTSIESIIKGLTKTSKEEGISSVDYSEENIKERVFELTSTGMFSLDDPNIFDEETKLNFIANALETEFQLQYPDIDQDPSIRIESGSQQPFINVSHGSEFANSHDKDFFPKTFPSLFPFGRGGPKGEQTDMGNLQSISHSKSLSLKYWANTLLRRHGGRFATHPMFVFLVFNMLVRSSNRRISTARMSRSQFKKVEQLYESLTQERLEQARQEMIEIGRTTDQGVQLLLRELSIFGYAQPLSNDTRLQMRRKIISLCIRIGIPAIWFTINPNDLGNPIKFYLMAHRTLSLEAAKDLLDQLHEYVRKIAMSINDPVSSVEFFRREIELFFKHFVKIGEDSIFGHISHYYSAIETNDRGALHLHGLIWFTGNIELHKLSIDMANPEEEEYQRKVIAFVNDVFTECLDAEEGSEIRKYRKVTDIDKAIITDSSFLKDAFESEANFVAFCSQVHSHSPTCVKYSIKDIAKVGFSEYKRQPCRFKAPWKIIPETHYTNDGILEIKRNHQMVNRYNKSIAIALRHNHDISMILSKKQGLSLLYYMTNYATKLHTPMWKRITFAAEVYNQVQSSQQSIDDGNPTLIPKLNKTRQFLMRLANKVFTDRELSAVEVVNHLFDYETDYTNIKVWTYQHLNTLYWAIIRQWPSLQDALFDMTGSDPVHETIQVRSRGYQLSYIEAYQYRGLVLEDLCFYDYLSFVKLERRPAILDKPYLIPFDELADFTNEWIQHLRNPSQIAVPSLQGYLGDDHNEEHEIYFKRLVILFIKKKNYYNTNKIIEHLFYFSGFLFHGSSLYLNP